MDAIFALIFVVYILSAVFQAVLGKGARKRQRGAGAPWPGARPPGKTPDEAAPIPEGLPFPFPFPFEEIFGEKHEEEPPLEEFELTDETSESIDSDDKGKVSPWEDKSWGSLGKSLEGQSLEEIEHDEFYDLHVIDDFADDFDDIALIEDDIAELMVMSESVPFELKEFTSRSSVIQGIIMSEVLKRPKAFSRYPIIRQ